jgi:predicted CoA-substrate-specific enzyme activase
VIFAGIDIGSTTTKAILIDETCKILVFSLIPTGFDRNKSGEEVLERALKQIGKSRGSVKHIASTGYGRRSLEISEKVLPEIICHARGTSFLYPKTKTIIDIGGQDSKVIQLDDDGAVLKFEMNDKCAAGTGRFFEVLTERILNISLDELGPLSLKSKNSCVFSSVCTIFAESEIISFLSSGTPKEDIAAGMHKAVAKRIVSMGRAGQIPFEEPIILSGGVAKNIGAVKAFEELLGKRVITLENPQCTAALGVALFAKETFKRGAT